VIGRCHVAALRAARDAELVLCVDQDPATAASCPADAAFSGDLEALADHGLDAVIVATPEQAHRDAVEAALAAGAAVLCEKPFAATLEDADAMAAAATRHDRPLFVAHTLRFDPRYVAIHADAARGAFGPLISLSARRCMDAEEGRIYAGRTDLALCLGVHDIDVMRWCAGEIAQVSAEAGPSILHEASHDALAVSMRFGCGAVGHLDLCWALPPEAGVAWDTSFVVVGVEGSRYLELRGGHGGDLMPELTYEFDVHGLAGGVVRLQDEHFLRAVRDPTAWPGASLDDARRAVEIALAIGAAVRAATPVEVV
jgi:predicted dehydrogenase